MAAGMTPAIANIGHRRSDQPFADIADMESLPVS